MAKNQNRWSNDRTGNHLNEDQDFVDLILFLIASKNGVGVLGILSFRILRHQKSEYQKRAKETDQISVNLSFFQVILVDNGKGKL